MKKLPIFLTFILLSGCQNPTEQAELKSTPSASSGGLLPSQWESSNVFPLSVKYGSDFDSDEIAALTQASKAWNNTNQGSHQYVSLAPSSFSSRNHFDDFRDSELGIYKIYDWPSDMPATALAVTQIFGKKNGSIIKIDHADILLNYDYFDFSATDDWGYDLQTVVVHEMGHFLGLYHEKLSADQSVMYPTISRYRYNRTPHDHDEEQLAQKYPPTRAIKTFYRSQDSNDEEEVILRLELHKNGKETYRIKRGIK